MNYNTAKQIVGSDLGHASKMPTKTWGISAKDCITGSKLSKILGSICAKCFAMRGNYLYNNVNQCHQRRLDGISHPEWVDSMVYLMIHHSLGLFRWFDSGDLQSVEHLQKIVEIAKRLPQVKFWLPTQERGFITKFLKTNTIPSNLIIRISNQFINSSEPKTKLLSTTSSVLTKPFFVKAKENKSVVRCMSKALPKEHPAYGKCGTCRACWNKDVKHIYYLQH